MITEIRHMNGATEEGPLRNLIENRGIDIFIGTPLKGLATQNEGIPAARLVQAPKGAWAQFRVASQHLGAQGAQKNPVRRFTLTMEGRVLLWALQMMMQESITYSAMDSRLILTQMEAFGRTMEKLTLGVNQLQKRAQIDEESHSGATHKKPKADD